MADRPEQEMTEGALPALSLASSQAAPKPARRAEITVEFSQVVVIRKPEGLVVEWCPACGGPVNMVTAEAAAVLSDVGARTVYRRIEAGALHFAETPEGLVLICLNSLFSGLSRTTPCD